jgi:hypothetical protein
LKSRKVVIPWIFLSGSETVLCGNEWVRVQEWLSLGTELGKHGQALL